MASPGTRGKLVEVVLVEAEYINSSNLEFYSHRNVKFCLSEDTTSLGVDIDVCCPVDHCFNSQMDVGSL